MSERPSYWHDELLPMSGCKRKLTLIWLVLGLGILFLLLLRTATGGYGDETNAVWSWFLPNIMPTLMLMIGVLVVDDARRRKAGDDEKPEAEASGFLFRVAVGLSLAHLLLLMGMVLGEPLFDDETTMGTLTGRMGYLTGPFQGLIAAALGAFFTR